MMTWFDFNGPYSSYTRTREVLEAMIFISIGFLLTLGFLFIIKGL